MVNEKLDLFVRLSMVLNLATEERLEFLLAKKRKWVLFARVNVA